jgi:hypothetical protein
MGSVDYSYTEDTTIPLAEARSDKSSAKLIGGLDGLGAKAVDIIEFHPSVLLRRDGSHISPKLSLPEGKRHASLEMGNELFVLYPMALVGDDQSGYLHAEFVIVNYPGSYARFSFDVDSGLIAGTVSVDGLAYRLLPLGAGDLLAVFQIQSPTIQLSKRASVSESVKAIEKAHSRVEALALYQPFRYHNQGSMVIVKGTDSGLRGVRVERPKTLDGAAIADLVTKLSPLTDATGDEVFEVTKRESWGDPEKGKFHRVKFRQMLRGLPLRKENILEVSSDGRIVTLQVMIADETWISREPPIVDTEEQALELGIQELVKRGFSRNDIVKSEWGYFFGYAVTSKHNLSPMLYSTFRVKSAEGRSEGYIVSVNLHNGEVIVASTKIPFLANIYKPKPPYTAPVEVGPETTMVWQDTGSGHVCVSVDIDDCTPPNPIKPEYSKPKDYISELRGLWNTYAGGICCDNMNDPIALIAESDAAEDYLAYWDADIATLVFSPGISQYPDIVAHELAHAYLTAYNPTFFTSAVTAAAASPPDYTGYAIMEGLADVIASLYSELTTYSGDIGSDAWLLGELPGGAVRDLTVSADWSLLDDERHPFHARGLSVGNFMYRLRNTNAASIERLLRLALQISQVIDEGDDDQIRSDDIKVAASSAMGVGDTALAQAIDYMWFEPLLLIGADVDHWTDPIIDESTYGHTVTAASWKLDVLPSNIPGLFDGLIHVFSSYGDMADASYFYAEDEVFKLGDQAFTVEAFIHTYGPAPTPNPIFTNNLPLGDPDHWAVQYKWDSGYSRIQLRVGSTSVESSKIWPNIDNYFQVGFEHIALVRIRDRGIVYFNGTPVIDEPTIFSGVIFSTIGDERVSFAGWEYGDNPGTGPLFGYWDEIRVSRGARYSDAFSKPTSKFPRPSFLSP